MGKILDQFGREYIKASKPEQSTLAVAPIMDSMRTYVSAGLTPLKLARYLRSADSGNIAHQVELFDQMEEKDAHLLGEMEKRRNAILDVDFKVSPASEDARDVKIADFIEDYFQNLTDWDDTLTALQDAVGKGFSCLEMNWDVSSGQALPTEFEFLEQKRFNFMNDKGHLLKYPLLMSDENYRGEEIPAWKVIFHRYGGKSGHAAKSGLYRVCAWMYLFRNYGLKDWMTFLDIFGIPLRLGRYEQGATKEDKDALIAAIRSLGTDAAGIISKNTEIEFVEAIKSGSSKEAPHKTMLEFCAKEISKAILGQTLSADVGDTGSYAASQTHNEVRLDLAKADTRAIAATVRFQVIRPIVGFNFGWEAATPNYKAIWTEDEDLKPVSEVYKNVIELGQPVSAEHVSERFGIPLPKEGETVLTPISGNSPGLALKLSNLAHNRFKNIPALISAGKDAHAEALKLDAEQQEIEEISDLSLEVALKAFRSIDGPVKKMIRESESLEDLRDKIFSAYKGMNPADLEQLVKDALITAAFQGVADVMAENKGE